MTEGLSGRINFLLNLIFFVHDFNTQMLFMHANAK